MRRSTRATGFVILGLVFVCLLLWWTELLADQKPHVMIVHSGAGVVLVIRDGPHTVVVGGGKDGGVVRDISSVMPWFTHTIDAFIIPDLSVGQSGGVIDVIRRFNPSFISLSQGVRSGAEWVSLQQTIQKSTSPVMTLTRGQVITDGFIRIEPLFPDRLMPHTDTHTGCVTMRISVGSRTLLSVCDLDPTIIPYLIFMEGHQLHADTLIMPETLFKSDFVRLLIGYTEPKHIVVVHDCKQEIASSTSEIVLRFGAQMIDVCTQNARLLSGVLL